jgi:hypothetical protein
LKTRKRWIALLTAVVMVAALLVPFAGTASAATTYSLSYVPSVSAGTTVIPNNLFLTVTMDNTSALNLAGSQVILELPSTPSGYKMVVTPVANSLTGVFIDSNLLSVLAASPNVSGQGTASITVNIPSTYTASAYTGSAVSSSFALQFTSLTVPGGVNGNVTLYAAAPNGSMFANGSLTIATAGTGSVTLAAESVQSVSSGSAQPIGYIDITESMAGALSNSGGTALKLTLPAGVTWDTNAYILPVWGAPLPCPWLLSYGNGGRELDISTSNGVSSTVYDSTTAMFVKLVGTVDIDQSVAKQGDVVVTVGGSSTYTPSTLTVANFGTYAISAKVLSTPTITAGMAGSTIGAFEVLEGLPGSLIIGRTIDMTLPSNVAWSQVPQIDTSNSTLDSFSINSICAVGSSGNEIEITLGGAVSTASESPAVIAFKNAEVTPAVDFTGALNVTVGGTEGLTGTINLGTVAAGVTAAASAEPSIAIGTANAAVGDLTITEAASGNIQSIPEYSGLDTTGAGPYNSSGANPSAKYFVATDSNGGGNAEIDVWAPTGVTFFNTPTVTVTAGDLQLGTVSTNTVTNQGEIIIPIKSTSTIASTISITGAQVTVDRTVPGGAITFKVKGTGVDETELGTAFNNVTNVVALFPNDTTAAAVNVATVGTGVNGGTSVFTIGSTSYTLNGTSVSMDVAPYIKDSRTFLPVRYVANALGVADSSIMWDAASQKVTIIKGSTVVQMTIGSTTMVLNGATITMDTAPEITSGRTCLPIAWVAEALNANIVWDATAQTVTVTSN